MPVGSIAKRLLDLIFGVAGLLVGLPFIAFAGLGIKLTSPGPIFYQASRTGIHGHLFTMYKLRTMHVRANQGSLITGPDDKRVFWLGRFLRKTKIDELPQLINVLKGEMSIVGPRPEDPEIVRQHYSEWMKQTLLVRPGLTSLGALWGYVYGDQYLDENNEFESYVQKQMPRKLAVESLYLKRASLLLDALVIVLTPIVILSVMTGRPYCPQWREFKEAEAHKH